MANLQKVLVIASDSATMERQKKTSARSSIVTSLVVPLHNEEENILYTLRSILDTPVDEIVFVLDRCTDNTLPLLMRYCKGVKRAKIVVKNWKRWQFNFAETCQIGFNHSKGNVVFICGGDIILDKRMFAIAKRLLSNRKVACVSFKFYNRTLHRSVIQGIYEEYINILRGIFERISPNRHKYHSGVAAIKKQHARMEDVARECDQLFSRIERLGYVHRYVKSTKIIHLRGGLTKDRKILIGRGMAYLPYYSTLKVFLDAVLFFRPCTFVAYLHEKRSMRAN